jgi:hypothetical protein
MVTKMEQKILNKIWYKLDSLEANMATKADLAEMEARMATKEDLAKMASKDDLNELRLATKSDLAEMDARMATKEDLAKMASKDDLNELRSATRTDLTEHDGANQVLFKQIMIELIQIKDQTNKIPRMENDIRNIKDDLHTVQELQVKLNNDFESAIPVMESRLQ